MSKRSRNLTLKGLAYKSNMLLERTRNARNHRNDGIFHKSCQILKQIKRIINQWYLGKISHLKAIIKFNKIINLSNSELRIKFSIESTFSNMHYGKKWKPGNVGNQQKAF